MAWWVAGATVGSSIIGGIGQQQAAGQAANAQIQAANISAQIQREILASQKEIYGEQVGRLEPFREAGLGGLEGLVQLSTPEGQTEYLNQYYQGPQFQAQSQAAQNQQLAASEATGGLQSTSTQNQLARIAPTLGNQALQQQQQIYGNLAGIGLQGAGAQGGYGGQYGSALGQFGQQQTALQQGIGAAHAGSALAGGNALSGIGQSIQSAGLYYGLKKGLF